MLQPFSPSPQPLIRMPDGTVKQLNPFSGTEVWTVPGRGHRPLGIASPNPQPLDPDKSGRHCAFCELRKRETPPEKARRVCSDGQWATWTGINADALDDSRAEFRRVPNLFEIITYDYWVANYGYVAPEHLVERHRRYANDRDGRAHLLAIGRTKLLAGGLHPDNLGEVPEEELIARGMAFFAGGHDVIIGRRHYIDGAENDSQLCGSGQLTPEEHLQYTIFTIEALADLYATNRYARYVAVFQNWLKPAGASFDHLHKQLAAIDERGVQSELELLRLRANPNLYNEFGANYAGQHNLVIAENEVAIAFAGVGHRFPTIEIYSKSAQPRPWLCSPEEQRGMSDLVHACHAAAGPDVPVNEEWHHQPIDVEVPMPWRINLKWRVSTLAGFEGGTKIYLNTIDPWSLRDRVVPNLYRLRDQGLIAPVSIATECPARPNDLRYATGC